MASVPFSDRYVDAVLPTGAVRVGTPDEPSRWLDERYLTEHAAEIDVLHLHSGYAHLGVLQLERWAEAVRRLGVPLVVTVHQLRDAGQSSRARHDAHLESVLGTAEVVLTLTPSAADEIADRYGRTAIVLAHPSLAVPDPDLGAERGLVGVQLGTASAAVPDPAAVARAAASGAVSGGGRLRVLAPVGSDVDPGVREMAGNGELELVVHRPEEVADQLQQLHVAVLPERCGTHSRDLEVCRDVGTRVVAPSCGFFADQWSEVVTYGNDEVDGLDPVSLTAAVSAALTRPMPRPADRTWRGEQAEAVRRVHAEVYAQVAADRSWV
ncbi:glycosyltransferase [Blastococcus goldschmidtiae]|uniref:Glycosyltransferase n=1 Tax=Blastococcus goldschmidtiae TaxID=3075546 RepID=A0ABU2K3F8_9ACTN|nr:glycosyltransferase [Blastococcus sp. DSM 46792]MDT0274733.1 glycosyltransferase [Blastococcus sp. DSM 46792]